MRSSTPFSLWLVAALALTCAAQGQGERFLVCYPNAPGSARRAEPIMQTFGAYVGDRLQRRVRPTYFNELSAAQDWMAQEMPRHGILSLSLYLRWREQHSLRVVAHAERGGKGTGRYHLLVPASSKLRTLADLAQREGACVWSAHLDDARFASRIVFEGKLRVKDVWRDGKVEPGLPKGQVRVVSSDRALSALRRMEQGKPYKGNTVDAVLVDDTSWEGLQQLERFKGVFRVLYASPPLPTAPVVSFGDVPESESKRLGEVLEGMKKDDDGLKILKTLQATGFCSPQRDALAALVARYQGEGKTPGDSK